MKIAGKQWVWVAASGIVASLAIAALLVRGDIWGRSSGSGLPSTVATPSLSLPSHGIACIKGQCYVNGSPVPNPSPPSTARPTSPFPSPSIPDFIKVQVPQDRSWGCVPAHGAHCKLPFEGVVFLETADKGQILLQVFEDDRPAPAASRTLIPAVKGRNVLCTSPRCPYSGSNLDYTIGADAKRAIFKVVLQDLNGKTLVIAEAGDFLY